MSSQCSPPAPGACEDGLTSRLDVYAGTFPSRAVPLCGMCRASEVLSLSADSSRIPFRRRIRSVLCFPFSSAAFGATGSAVGALPLLTSLPLPPLSRERAGVLTPSANLDHAPVRRLQEQSSACDSVRAAYACTPLPCSLSLFRVLCSSRCGVRCLCRMSYFQICIAL